MFNFILGRDLTVRQRLMTLGAAGVIGIGSMLAVGWYQNARISTAIHDSIEIKNEVEQLPNAYSNGQMSPFYREAMRLHSGLAVMTPETMNEDVYRRLEKDLENLSDLLGRTYCS